MAYTVVGMFPTNEAADKASEKLDGAGFAKEDYQVSRYSTTAEYNADSEYEEDAKTSGFWSWLFGDDDREKKKYSYAGTKSNIVTVYTNDSDRAEKARDIMNEQGALDVNDFTKDRFTNSEAASNNSSDQYARIIAKAKNDLFLTGENRTYNFRTRGMSSGMDAAGSEDAF